MTADPIWLRAIFWLAVIGGPFLILWAREREAQMEQCETCGPMYFGEHHPDCPLAGAPEEVR